MDEALLIPARRSSLSSRLRTVHARSELRGNPDNLALALLTALHSGFRMTQIHRDVRPLEVSLDAILEHIETLTTVRSPHVESRRAIWPADLVRW
jgi:TetR/AcrR family transcriptional regulator, transcriptional repressor for nem operon